MDYEQFKERIEEDLHQALADHGIDANFSQHHVEKLNAWLLVWCNGYYDRKNDYDR